MEGEFVDTMEPPLEAGLPQPPQPQAQGVLAPPPAQPQAPTQAQFPTPPIPPTQPSQMLPNVPQMDSPLDRAPTPQSLLDGAAASFEDLNRMTMGKLPTAQAGLRRTTSGIRGTTAPLWENVERELRQSTLTDFLRRMFDTLSQQHQALEKLNEVAMKNVKDIAELKDMQVKHQDRFVEGQEVLNHNMADRLSKIEGDLGMQLQEMGTQQDHATAIQDDLAQLALINNAEKKTLRQTVDELAGQHNKLCSITRRGKYGRLKVTGWMLAELNLKGVCRRFFNKWMTWLRMGTDVRQAKEGKEAMVMLALTDTRRQPLRRYFEKLNKFVDWARKQHLKADRYCKAIRRLNYTRSISTLAHCWGKLKRYLVMIAQESEEHMKKNVQKANMLEEISVQSLMKRYFNKLAGKRNIRVQFNKKAELCHSLGKMCLDTISKRYFDKLSVFLMWRKYQRKRYSMAVELEAKSDKLVLRRYITEMADGVAASRRMLERTAISRALATKNAQVLRRDFFMLLSRYRVQRREQRDKDEQDNRIGEVVRKTDNLGTQIDVGLKTLSNTNSVLNKLVDRLISVDQQIDGLEKEKVSRRELSFITDPARHPSLLDEQPSQQRMISQDPRTSPPPIDPPIERYMPSVMSDERQLDLERERERDHILEMQQAAEMERRSEQLDRLVSSMEDKTLRGEASPLSNLTNRPMAAPYMPRQAPATPSTDGGDDLAQQLKAQFERELRSQQASYRNIVADLSSDRYM
eukprot:TRINITY_DN15966_c0_g1_i1.p1 TRINITY_DN15966_c0_g1~~TRINITY_DN15966_c0_g1_i1.p1  ORF type:complete len:746 (+),score=195.09 TRINITY_DN15966_c0_g1_i1:37-2274(+)